MPILNRLQDAYLRGELPQVPVLAELMDAIGKTVIELPCEVGDTVYRIVNDAQPHIVKDQVFQMSFNDHGQWIVLTGNRVEYLSDFEKVVFLTRPEAEHALERSQGHG